VTSFKVLKLYFVLVRWVCSWILFWEYSKWFYDHEIFMFVQANERIMSTVLMSLLWLASQPEARHIFPRSSPGISIGLALTQKVIYLITPLSCWYERGIKYKQIYPFLAWDMITFLHNM
jgi:hypothetical protein